IRLGRWVQEAACFYLATRQKRSADAPLSISINISAKEFHQPGFVEQILSIIRDTGANPHLIKLELTESVLLKNVEEAIGKMKALKAQGLGFSLDDFGTGYSSLSYLKRLPLDQVKIDRSFVRDLIQNANDAAIARTIVDLARTLGLEVIAEGVETEEQRSMLAGYGCHAYQGYLFSEPLSSEMAWSIHEHSLPDGRT
ncbi:MAG: hypothetical protein K0S28_508, partial [Paucimonas sp.]|nr:hypothetical protein [Paucimonas sp.]